MHPIDLVAQTILAGLRRTEMSEFEARCGCLLSSHELLDGRCPIHDEPIVRMDGLSDNELRRLEWEFDTRHREEEEDGTDSER